MLDSWTNTREVTNDFTVDIVVVLNRVFDGERAEFTTTVKFGARRPSTIEAIAPFDRENHA